MAGKRMYGITAGNVLHSFRTFHVDNLSSAHIYLRLTTGQSWEDIPKELVDDCAQLTKANSIEGNKRDNVTVIYTPWSNLKKDGSMAVGQVSFHDPKKTKRILLTTRLNPVVNRLTKTRTEIPPPASSAYLLEARDSHLATKRKAANAILQERKKEEARLAKERREEKLRREREWEELYGPEAVQRARMKNGGTEIEDVWEGEGGEVSNHDGFDEDDFM
ncbi:hypothetical protein MMC19_006404 [Ptychographa xylographoides]|nr:hypothetical protein [Ptychographa xylographoides]